MSYRFEVREDHGLGHIFEKIRLVGHFGITTARYISIDMKVETIFKFLNIWQNIQ